MTKNCHTSSFRISCRNTTNNPKYAKFLYVWPNRLYSCFLCKVVFCQVFYGLRNIPSLNFEMSHFTLFVTSKLKKLFCGSVKKLLDYVLNLQLLILSSPGDSRNSITKIPSLVSDGIFFLPSKHFLTT